MPSATQHAQRGGSRVEVRGGVPAGVVIPTRYRGQMTANCCGTRRCCGRSSELDAASGCPTRSTACCARSWVPASLVQNRRRRVRATRGQSMQERCVQRPPMVPQNAMLSGNSQFASKRSSLCQANMPPAGAAMVCMHTFTPGQHCRHTHPYVIGEMKSTCGQMFGKS